MKIAPGPGELGLTKVTSVRQSPFQYKGIGISGKMGSGKSSVAKEIATLFGWPVRSLATQIKTDVEAAFLAAGLDLEEGQLIPNHKDEIRGTLQEWGAMFRKYNGENWWVRQLFSHNRLPFIVDDVRFQNEFEGLRARGFLLIRLDVLQATQRERIARLYPSMDEAKFKHPSETDLDNYYNNFDIVVPSDFQLSTTMDAITKKLAKFQFTKEAPSGIF